MLKAYPDLILIFRIFERSAYRKIQAAKPNKNSNLPCKPTNPRRVTENPRETPREKMSMIR